MLKYWIVGRNDKNDYWTLERCTNILIEAYFWKFVYSFKYKEVGIRGLYGEEEYVGEKWRLNYGTTV